MQSISNPPSACYSLSSLKQVLQTTKERRWYKEGSSKNGTHRGIIISSNNNVTIVKAEPKRVFFLPIFLMDIPPAGSLLSLTVIVQEPAVVLDYVGPKLAITMN